MKLPRCRLRTLMIAVALVAALLGGGIWAVRMRRLSETYWGEAQIYGLSERLCRGEGPVPCSGMVGSERYRNPEGAAYAARMRRKYERAARYPWLPVEPDPPPPDP